MGQAAWPSILGFTDVAITTSVPADHARYARQSLLSASALMIASSPPRAGSGHGVVPPQRFRAGASSRLTAARKSDCLRGGMLTSALPTSSQSYLKRGADHQVIRVFPLRMPQCDAGKVVELVEPELRIEGHP